MPRVRKTTQQYIADLISKDLAYIVPNKEYQQMIENLEHLCTKCSHIWIAKPVNILKSKGCPNCHSHRNKKTHTSYLVELKDKGIVYAPLEKYINNITPILHRCNAGHEWSVRPNAILSGHGCPSCSPNRRKTSEEYKLQLKSKNIDFIILEEYTNAKTPILHQCLKGHTWSPSPSNVLRGQGCPSCSATGFDPKKPATLYYLKITSKSGIYYKIGITNTTVARRFSRDANNALIDILYEEYYSVGADAYLVEQEILKEHKDKRVTVPSLLKSKGNTELFLEDVLGLDW